jgi:hypothetical protein
MYAKVFSSLWDGSMRGQSDKQLVFIYLLAHADADGVAEIIQGKIADDTGLREDEVFAALSELMSPDPASRTDGSDGRRLEPLDARGWGWSIVNYQHYRGLRDDEERRRQNREAQSRHRSKPPSADVSQDLLISAQGEAEGEGEVQPKDLSVLTWKEEFETSFWPSLHPDRRQAKAEALIEWMKLKPRSQATLDLVCDAMEVDVAGWNKEHTEPKYIPHARKWLKDRRYLDHAED